MPTPLNRKAFDDATNVAHTRAPAKKQKTAAAQGAAPDTFYSPLARGAEQRVRTHYDVAPAPARTPKPKPKPADPGTRYRPLPPGHHACTPQPSGNPYSVDAEAFGPAGRDAVLRDLSAPRLQELRDLSRDAQRTAAAHPGHILAFLANDASLGEIPIEGRRADGMVSAVAVWSLWTRLQAARNALANELSPAEKRAADDLLGAYRQLYLSSLLSVTYRHNPRLRAEFDAMAGRGADGALQAGINPYHANVFDSGYDQHFTVTRFVTPGDDYLEPGGEIPPTLQIMFEDIDARLGVYGEEHVDLGERSLPLNRLVHLRPADSERHLTEDNYLVAPADKHGRVIVTYLRGNQLCDRYVHLDALDEELQRLLPRRPLLNAAKITVHNGGDLSNLSNHQTRSFDVRLTLPLEDAKAVLGTIRYFGVVGSREQAEEMLSHLRPGADMVRRSVEASPLLPAQNMGNCTVHSQLLFSLYHLQHGGDAQGFVALHGNQIPATTPLSSKQGLGLFKKLWGHVLYDLILHHKSHHSPLAARGLDAWSALDKL